jgi:hypothetical protein
MRLKNVEQGHREAQKAALLMIQARRGPNLPVPDVLRTMLYRPELFGEAYSDGLEEILHGSSDWSVGERELFATFVSSKNRCQF